MLSGPIGETLGPRADHGAANNTEKVIGYIRAYQDSVAWLYEPANRIEAIDILCRYSPQMQRDITAASYPALLHTVHGFFPNCELDRKGL